MLLTRLRWHNLRDLHKKRMKFVSYSKCTTVLGIETSCDDTGCAIVNESGKILGESLYSQQLTHTRHGGINPAIARELHRENIENAVDEAINKSMINISNIDAIAVTVKPGLFASLEIGVKYARHLARKHQKPLIPIHHMEAHALVVRMFENIKYPFLVLLISGGHCLLGVARDVDDFLLLGKSIDNTPGEIYDKVARRMKLRNIPEYSSLSGGQAVEMAAKNAKDPNLFQFATPLLRERDCNFSFSGFLASLHRKLKRKETEHSVLGDELIPEVNDLCAAFQIAVTEHIMHRTQRAIEYCLKENLINHDNKTLIVSGGVACNNFMFNSLKALGKKSGFVVHRPPRSLCTDNGVMIAWNGMEKLLKGYEFNSNLDVGNIDPQAKFGKDIINIIKKANMAVRVTRIKSLLENYS